MGKEVEDLGSGLVKTAKDVVSNPVVDAAALSYFAPEIGAALGGGEAGALPEVVDAVAKTPEQIAAEAAPTLGEGVTPPPTTTPPVLPPVDTTTTGDVISRGVTLPSSTGAVPEGSFTAQDQINLNNQVGAQAATGAAAPASTALEGAVPPAVGPSASTELTAEEAAKKIAQDQAQAATGPDFSKALQFLGITDKSGNLGPSALPLGALTLSQVQAGKQRDALQKALSATPAASKVSPVASQLLDQYQAGQINPAQEKQISDYVNQQKASIKQRYASMGRDPNTDSAAQSEMANIDASAVAMRDQAQQGILSSGLSAAGVAQGPQTQAIMAGYQSDLASQQAVQNYLNTLARMQAYQAGVTK